MSMFDYEIYHRLKSGKPARHRCMGRSMEPVYLDQEVIFIFPFTTERPDPVVGDVVHFFTGGYAFNRHQVADIFTDSSGTVWYRLIYGSGHHDQFVQREQIIGYVIPQSMLEKSTEPRLQYLKE